MAGLLYISCTPAKNHRQWSTHTNSIVVDTVHSRKAVLWGSLVKTTVGQPAKTVHSSHVKGISGCHWVNGDFLSLLEKASTCRLIYTHTNLNLKKGIQHIDIKLKDTQDRLETHNPNPSILCSAYRDGQASWKCLKGRSHWQRVTANKATGSNSFSMRFVNLRWQKWHRPFGKFKFDDNQDTWSAEVQWQWSFSVWTPLKKGSNCWNHFSKMKRCVNLKCVISAPN